MKIINYPQNSSYNQIFEEVRLFIQEINENFNNYIFHWSRWEWYIARKSFDDKDLSKNLLFYDDNDHLTGLLLLEDDPEVYYYLAKNKSVKEAILSEILKQKTVKIMIEDQDEEMKEMVKKYGLISTNYKEYMAGLKVTHIPFHLPSGYDIHHLKASYDVKKHNDCLWRGFNHTGEPPVDNVSLKLRERQISSPHFNKAYAYVCTYDDQYVSYASIWYEKGTKIAQIEPVATVPEHRRNGLASATLSKCIDQVKKDGAEYIYVGSDQEFYKWIGFEIIQVAKVYAKF